MKLTKNKDGTLNLEISDAEIKAHIQAEKDAVKAMLETGLFPELEEGLDENMMPKRKKKS
jgi:hypothetical protein